MVAFRSSATSQSATLNGSPLLRPFLLHADIVKGGALVFAMGPEPNRAWGATSGLP